MPQDNIIKNNLFGFIIAIIALTVLGAGLYTEWLWFDSLSYVSVFKTILLSKVSLGMSVFLVFIVLFSLNFLVLRKNIENKFYKMYFGASFIISVVAGIFSSTYWFTVLRFLNFTAFSYADTVFKQDIGFYVFVLPFYKLVLGIIFFLFVSLIFVSAASYLLSGKKKKTVRIEPQDLGAEQVLQQIKLEFSEKGKLHIAIFAGFLLIVLAGLFYIRRYDILFSSRGAVYGAGFTDVNVLLPLYSILALVAILTAVMAFLFPYLKNMKLVVGAVSIMLIIFFGGSFVSGLVQSLYVQPNEFNLEEPYLKENIKHTLFAYGLTNINTRDFPVSYDLTMDDINKNEVTIQNVRLWDWRPLLTTNKQIQLFRTYYDFIDVDIDRYEIDGKLRQLMLSPRELDPNQLDSKAKTFVNEKFVYTHGYGAVVSPINSISKEGLPELFVKDIPPKTDYKELEITTPGIYFGEKTQNFVVTNTKTNEFDYPLGNENVFTVYDGKDGIQLSNIFKKALFSIKLGSLNLFVSSAVTEDSKVLFRRNIMDRVSSLAPFLQYDNDPYIVIDNGKLFWIIDAYTTTDKFPYSEPVSGINYIRNSVKIVVDAYNGNADFYVINDEDPLIKNYAKVFPELFKDFKEMPAGLKKHIRYPEDLMRVQTRIFGTYHMLDPQVFYNREDVWRTPTEIYRSNEIELRPYYIVLKLPDSEKEGFFLITPLIPRGKENMIAWFAAHSDPESYGKLEVFKLSKQELTYGPMQIEARIDQDTDISQLLTLWGQQGSEVIRGNLIIIPIETSFLYIEPIYLKASASGALPQLKRVIVSYEDQVAMEETFEGALSKIFKGKLSALEQEVKERKEQENIPLNLEEKLREASKLYDEAQASLQKGSLTEYAKKIEELGKILED
ncbi:UPF0182 family protein [Candidatus Woesearchaeota archaeon]|nr:UPF0182 family protein [Candidatus Woesearchaeota archaeon]